MAEHTKGPMRLNAGDSLKIMDADNRVAFYAQCGGMTGISLADAESNAETMVARWNALEGYNPDAVRDAVKILRANAVTLGVTRMRLSEREMAVYELDIAIAETNAALARLESGAS